MVTGAYAPMRITEIFVVSGPLGPLEELPPDFRGTCIIGVNMLPNSGNEGSLDGRVLPDGTFVVDMVFDHGDANVDHMGGKIFRIVDGGLELVEDSQS